MAALALFSAGSNARGQLATGDADDAHTFTPCIFSGCPPGRLPEHIGAIRQIACGANHTLALLERLDGAIELWGCGDGGRGQLGPSYAQAHPEGSSSFVPLDLRVDNSESYTVTLVAAGWETSYVVLSSANRDRSDRLLSMGANDFGNLGAGPAPLPTNNGVHTVSFDRLVQDPADAVLTVLALSAGPHHTVAHIRATYPGGTAHTFLAGWAAARHGQLGPFPPSSPSPVSTRARAPAHTPIPQLVPLPPASGSDLDPTDDILALALGYQHTVALHIPQGTLAALGSGRKGQLAGLDALRDAAHVACTWHGTYALARDGRVLATGSGARGQLGRGEIGVDAGVGEARLAEVRFPFGAEGGRTERLACGSEHVLCVVAREGEGNEGAGAGAKREVWGWGWNEHGNLGTGGTEDVGLPTRIWPRGEGDGEVVDVWAGCGTSWILVRGAGDAQPST